MPFIFNEDKALKSLLSGITVSDAKNPERTVGVWFGQPDLEIRDQSYPYLTIDLIDIQEDVSRAHRGLVTLPYTPENQDPDLPIVSEVPIPVDLYYQVTSYSRQPIHDRQIIAAILTSRLAMRFNHLEVPEDNTARRLDFLGYTKRDTVESNKRLLINTFSIKVSSEIISGAMVGYSPVETVNTEYTILTQETFTTP